MGMQIKSPWGRPSSFVVCPAAKQTLLLLFLAALLQAQSGTWFDLVSPILTSSEKKAYAKLSPSDREAFEENFFSGKSIDADEYFRRIQYVDAMFGSSKPASGANTDPGRVYLALGAPTKITHLPSSRIFVPLEIWYYDTVPSILNTELRLIFYQKNSVGLPRLYSPVVDTIRALLIPQAATDGMFGPNDEVTENDIRNNLTVPPAEDEVISAAVNIATGIKYSGNDQILGQITSPEAILRRPPETRVTSRLILSKPKLDIVQTPSPFGAAQIDLDLDTSAQKQLDIEVLQETASVYKNTLHLSFAKSTPVAYTHRLDLLPGSYQVMFTIDGRNYAYPLIVKDRPAMSDILRSDALTPVDRRQTAFEFDNQQVHLNSTGKFAAVFLPAPEKVTWMLRRGAEVVWRSVSESKSLAIVELPASGIQPGTYQLEAVTAGDARSTACVIAQDAQEKSDITLLSFNANLAPSQRAAFVAHQWLMRGNLDQARKNLELSLSHGSTPDAQVELARVDAFAGQLDAARDRVRRVLAGRPNDFQALAVLAYIETKFQDYAVAAELYRRALAVEDSPALRTALAKLPTQ
jgi:GWxTD domain-containing protein